MEASSHQGVLSRRVTRPTAKLADGSNVEKAPLGFQRVAVEAENARVKAIQQSEADSVAHSHDNASFPTLSQPESDSQLPPPSLASTRQTSPTLSYHHGDNSEAPIGSDTPPTGTKHHRPITPSLLSSDNEDSDHETPPGNAHKKKKTKRTHTANENSKSTSKTDIL